jgi:hypothetical protein
MMTQFTVKGACFFIRFQERLFPARWIVFTVIPVMITEVTACMHICVAERELFAMLKRVQNRQYDDQRGTSLTAFKEMPDFLKVPGDAKSADEAFSDKIANDNDILQQSQIEVCRRDDNDDDMDGEFACQDIQLSLTPSHVFQPACTFSEEFDSIMPSNDNAEHYFSQSVRVSSPDFNDSRLMECSLRDIGMESPVRGTRRRNGGGGGGWTLIGNVANVGQQLPKGDLAACGDDVFAVPISLPPSSRQHHNSISSVASRQPMKGDATDEIVEKRELESDRDRYFVKHNRPCELDLCNERRRSASNRSTPSPTTHDLLFINGECIVSKAVPYADEDVEFERFEDAADEMYGVV